MLWPDATAISPFMTTHELREDWIRYVGEFDRSLARLEQQKHRYTMPHRAWTVMLHSWRAEVERLLAEYPDHS